MNLSNKGVLWCRNRPFENGPYTTYLRRLAEKGANVVRVGSAEEAMTKLQGKESPVDLVIVEIEALSAQTQEFLPPKGRCVDRRIHVGKQLLLKIEETHPDVPVIAMAGTVTGQQLAQQLQNGDPTPRSRWSKFIRQPCWPKKVQKVIDRL